MLNLGTSLIAAIALGIAVDSTIHYMARLNLELQGETDQAAAVVRTLQAVGPPIIYTTRRAVLRVPHLRLLELRADPEFRHADRRNHGRPHWSPI